MATIILGIDPGLRNTGYGLIAVDGSALQYLGSGTIRSAQGSLPQRLREIFNNVAQIMGQYRPDRAAVEQVFVNVNPQSTLLLGQARGAALCALMSEPVQIAEYTPALIKQTVAGAGRAGKAEIQQMVSRLLHLPCAPSADAADALACAICDAHHLRMTQATGRALPSTQTPAGRRSSTSRRTAWAAHLNQQGSKESAS